MAPTIQGKPCRVCESTERYASTGACVACQCRHGQRRRIADYNIPVEFTRWVSAPLSGLTGV